MLEELFYIHRKTVEDIPLKFERYLHGSIDWNSPHICITGYRGAGKTTMLLQHYAQKYNDVEKCLYVSADNVEVSAIGLFRVASEYFKFGGEAIIIDEIHKYQGWEIELKNIIDTFKGKRVLVSGSSSLKLKQGKADLSRRVVYYNLKELSFREYLELREGMVFPVWSLDEILNQHVKISGELSKGRPILKYFRNYLSTGAYPFIVEGETTYLSKLLNVIEKAIYEDIAIAGDMKQSNIPVLKKILWLIASTVPFQVNIDKMSREFGISKEYVYNYLEYLDRAGMINSIASDGKGYRLVRKPSKILMANSNLLFAVNSSMMSESERGTVRETFFISQIGNIFKTTLSEKGDFKVNDKYVFEIGGPGKGDVQIKGIKDSYIAADGIEVGFGNKIPLHLFGFLY
jgi:predicted AAA+ superfamily ATPase